jgi:3-oxoacyl-[acyl-carrier protein] reductase
MESEFVDRTALVTGASRGIGRACAIQLAQSGANIAINYRANKDAALMTLKAVQDAGRQGIIVQADVSQPDDVDRLVQMVEQELGPVELLVNNAGVFDYVSHEETSLDIWQRALDNNLTSAYLVTWAVKSSMIERRFGRIVNVASIAGLEAKPRCIAYGVSKAGMISLTKSVAATLAEFDVRVNAVAPGLTETEILDGVSQEQLDALIAATPLKRIGQVNDISEVVTFLLSDRSAFMTGQTLVACGGRVMLP